ncbi:hypothetical protein [Treponema maltophilum]|uniref:hypothetical protein n=1 Tax=Treponema maltophilum TaxID=51160 RepID=UPI003D8FF730
MNTITLTLSGGKTMQAAARQALLRRKKCGHTAGKSRSYSVTDFKQRSHTPYYRPRR